MLYRALADVVVGLHFCFLAYVLFGGFLALRWPRTIALHLAAVAWGVVVVAAHLSCPLTGLQNALRRDAGEIRLRTGFIDSYVQGRFYPHGAELAAWTVAGLLVITSWWLFWTRREVRPLSSGRR